MNAWDEATVTIARLSAALVDLIDATSTYHDASHPLIGACWLCDRLDIARAALGRFGSEEVA